MCAPAPAANTGGLATPPLQTAPAAKRCCWMGAVQTVQKHWTCRDDDAAHLKCRADRSPWDHMSGPHQQDEDDGERDDQPPAQRARIADAGQPPGPPVVVVILLAILPYWRHADATSRQRRCCVRPQRHSSAAAGCLLLQVRRRHTRASLAHAQAGKRLGGYVSGADTCRAPRQAPLAVKGS